jgi:hypothetical protein
MGEVKEVKTNTPEEIQEEMRKSIDIYKMEELLKNNEYIFDYNGRDYKVRRPTYKEREEAFTKKLEKYMELLKDDKFIMEADLKKLYLKKGVDIDGLNKKIEQKLKERNQFLLKLGEALKNKASDNELLELKKQIEEMGIEINTLSMEKTNLLGPSIENQCLIFFFIYLTYLVTEKKVVIKEEGKEDKITWTRVWNSFDEYKNSDNGLINQASFYASIFGGTEQIPN